MAHFAQLDEDGKVLQVIVVGNDCIKDPETGQESEQLGVDFCRALLGQDTRWVQTSYNNTFRKRYAVIGGSYDATNDVFIPPAPFPSWAYNFESDAWEAPTPAPDDGMPWIWDEAALRWYLPTPSDDEELTDPELQALSAQIAAVLANQP